MPRARTHRAHPSEVRSSWAARVTRSRSAARRASRSASVSRGRWWWWSCIVRFSRSGWWSRPGGGAGPTQGRPPGRHNREGWPRRPGRAHRVFCTCRASARMRRQAAAARCATCRGFPRTPGRPGRATCAQLPVLSVRGGGAVGGASRPGSTPVTAITRSAHRQSASTRRRSMSSTGRASRAGPR